MKTGKDKPLACKLWNSNGFMCLYVQARDIINHWHKKKVTESCQVVRQSLLGR